MEAEDPHALRRTQILTESLETSNEPRWGYFGLSGSLAIGDNSYAPRLTKKAPAADDSGEPLRNMVTSHVKRGAGPDVYFRFELPLAIGDPYQDPAYLQKKGRVKMLDPDAAFRPAGRTKVSINKLGYEYEPHMDTAKDPKEVYQKYKGYLPPRGLYTNPTKKGGGGMLTKGVLFGMGEEGSFPEHMADDYDAPRKQRLKELKEHQSKIQETPFRAGDYGNNTFQNNSDAFRCDMPSHIPREPLPDVVPRVQHENAFRPTNPPRKGFKDSCFSFPEYIPDPTPGGAPRKKPPEGEAPPPYRTGAMPKSVKPTPSVMTLTRNLRSERPASFARPQL